MGFYDLINYCVYDNPVSKGVINIVAPKTSSPPSQPITIISDTKPLWKLAGDAGPFIRIAGLMGASAVALGAYGAHKSYPKDKEDELRAVYKTGNQYHFFHTLALFAVPLTRNPTLTGSLFIVGTTFFAGACYYRAFTGDDKFGKLAPVGGTILIIAWLSVIF